MRCPICGRPEHHPGNRMTHFVHDHMDSLDATRIAHNAELRLEPAPWQSQPSLKAELLDAWDRYPSEPHNLDNRTPERLESPVL